MTFTPDPAAPAGDSVRDEAFDRLKARYGDARKLVASEGDCANLDWILGTISRTDPASEGLSRKMVPLLSLWLEDLAVELDRGVARGLAGAMDEPSAAARRACESVATSLRQAASGFVATLQRAG